MSLFPFVIVLLAAETAVLSQAQTYPAPIGCLRVPCQNGATCVAQNNAPVCVCPPGFSGKFCEDRLISRNPCAFTVCQNGGNCVSPLDYPICQCPSGFGGKNCENKIPVKPGTCIPITNPDEGTCIKSCDGDFDCSGTQKCCPTFCEKRCTNNIIIDPCAGYCQNGGSCSAPADAPRCTCPYGYSGKRCEVCDSCTTTKRVIVGVCGGVFCKTNADCLSGQLCLSSPCGGKLCTGQPQTTPPTLTCANVLCNVGTVCRHVVTCATCPVEPKCIPAGQVGQDLDTECRRNNYSDVVLIENRRSIYDQLRCTGRSCPSGSECVGSVTRNSVCCRGKFVPVTPRQKPGVCPSGDVFVCGGVPCQNDYQCPGEQKCCSGCGTFCTNPVNTNNQELCGNSPCPRGQVCVQKQRQCAPNMFCIQALIPTCVPLGCAKCDYRESCRQTLLGYQCYTPTQ